MFEGLQQLQDKIDNASSIEQDLADLDNAKTDKQMLCIAHRISAKRKVRADIIFDIRKALNDVRAEKT